MSVRKEWRREVSPRNRPEARGALGREGVHIAAVDGDASAVRGGIADGEIAVTIHIEVACGHGQRGGLYGGEQSIARKATLHLHWAAQRDRVRVAGAARITNDRNDATC